MRIAVVTNYFEGHRGGVEIVAGALARGLAEGGAQVSWLASAGDPAPAPPNVRSVPLPIWNLAERRLGFPFPLTGPVALRTIAREVLGADLLLLHDSLCLPSLWAFAVAKLARKPVLLVQHIGEVPYANALLRSLMRLGDRCVARRLMAWADQVVFISAVTADVYRQVRFRRRPELIFNGVDSTIFHSVEPSPSATTGAPMALFVGRFVEKKGVDLVRRVAEARPDVSWVLAGWGTIDPDAWGLPNVQVMRDRSGASLAELYRQSDVLVLPSRGEGFPLVIQEALACGVPVICGAETVAADPQAAPWLNGVAVDGDPRESARQIAAALDRVLAEGKDAAAERARFARERYAWSSAVVRYRTLCAALAANTPRRTAIVARSTAPAMDVR